MEKVQETLRETKIGKNLLQSPRSRNTPNCRALTLRNASGTMKFMGA
jgi:hypothetical protein